MDIIMNLINEYGMTIISSVVMAIVSYIGVRIKSIYQKYIDDKTKENVVKTCVNAVEQIYKDLHGEEKYNKAIDSITEMLNQKGIMFTDLEIKMLIESTCREFSKSIMEGE